jgi:hypothetical protein
MWPNKNYFVKFRFSFNFSEMKIKEVYQNFLLENDIQKFIDFCQSNDKCFQKFKKTQTEISIIYNPLKYSKESHGDIKEKKKKE